MIRVNEVFDKALKNDLISVEDWNEGIFTYIIQRIVWETKYHEIVCAVDSEETAKRIVEEFNNEEYFYKKVRLN